MTPTRKGQPRDEDFDKATYERRNIVERVIGWYKEARRLGTRYERLEINYVAMWLVAIIEKALKRLLVDTASPRPEAGVSSHPSPGPPGDGAGQPAGAPAGWVRLCAAWFSGL